MISDQDAMGLDTEIIKTDPFKPKVATDIPNENSSSSTHPIVRPFDNSPDRPTLSVVAESGARELYEQMNNLPVRQDETTSTANRLVGDLTNTLRILADLQELLKQHGVSLESRRNQTQHQQEWIENRPKCARPEGDYGTRIAGNIATTCI